MKGGDESVIIENPNEVPLPVAKYNPNEESSPVAKYNPNEGPPPVALSDNTFDHSGLLLTLIAERRGYIVDSEGNTDMGIKAYKSLVVSAQSHEEGKYDKAGKYLLLTRHFAHHLRSAALKLKRNYDRELVFWRPDPLSVTYYTLKGVTKATKFGLDKSGIFHFTRNGMKKFFESLIRDFPELHKQLLSEEIDMDEMEELLEKKKWSLGVGNILQNEAQAPEQI